MTLPAGTRLGPYEIVASLGAGGMGVVYRGRDTRLGRTVAIKVLSPAFLADVDARRRFAEEARAISALNHPHICTLHDVGEHDGTTFLVMEHVEGETLAARLSRGSMPRRDVLNCAIELATALEAAHRRGIVHCDVKPANVMLTKNGAKLLDFGIASRQAPVTARAGDDTTHVTAAPAKGLVGTLAYMAPEQLDGRGADARSDIWALGIVLHEMLRGAPPFTGDSSAYIMSGILTADPAAPASGHAVLDHVVQTALAKDPEARWQSAADVATTLRLVAITPDSASATTRYYRAWGAIAAAAAVAVIVGAVTWRVAATPAGPSIRPVSLDIVAPDGVEFSTQGEFQAAWPILSPDGTRVVLTGRRRGEAPQLWVRRLDARDLSPLPGTTDAEAPFWAPDGRRLGFFADGKLKVVDVDGGTARPLADAFRTQARGGSWGRDGTILFAPGQTTGLMRINDNGGGLTAVTALDASAGETSHRWPCLLPDGRHFLYTVRSEGDSSGIYLGTLDGGARRRLLPDVSNAAFSPSGHILFGRAGALLAQPFDAQRLAMHGAALPVLDSIAFSPSYRFAAFSVSESGALAYGPSGVATRLEWLDRRGLLIARLGSSGAFLHPRLSPDGRRIVIARLDSQLSTFDLWTLDAERGDSMTRLTAEPTSERFPAWSPDGMTVAYSALQSRGSSGIWLRPSSGSGQPRELVPPATNGRFSSFVTDWSSDGRTVVFTAQRTDTNWDIDTVDASTGVATPFLQTPFLDVQGQLSPNGRWMAYASDESGTFEVYVRPFPQGEGRWLISTAGGQQPRWRADGGELFYLAADGTVMAVPLSAGPGLKPGSPLPLFAIAVPDIAPQVGRDYTVSSDGRRFLVNSTANSRTRATVVLNWSAALK